MHDYGSYCKVAELDAAGQVSERPGLRLYQPRWRALGRGPVVGLPLLVLGLAVAGSSGGIVVDDEGRSAGDEKLLADAAWNR